jgi:hypothetical protein
MTEASACYPDKGDIRMLLWYLVAAALSLLSLGAAAPRPPVRRAVRVRRRSDR